MRKGIRGRGIKVHQFIQLGLYSAGSAAGWRVGGKLERCRIPAALPLSDEVLRSVRLLHCGGELAATVHRACQPSSRAASAYRSVAGEPWYPVPHPPEQRLRRRHRQRSHGCSAPRVARKHTQSVYPTSGHNSRMLHWRRCCARTSTATGQWARTARSSRQRRAGHLASDLAYALKRFGIHARLRSGRKRATNSAHTGGIYFHVCVSGGEDLRRYANSIGFDHPEKSAKLRTYMERKTNTNVDVVPICPESLKELRVSLRLTMSDLGASSGVRHSAISLIESSQRRPSRGLLRRLLAALAAAADNQRVADFAWWRTWKRLNILCGVRWTQVKGVRPIAYPHPYVYDLSVPGPETFLAGHGGAIVHNTFTIANVIERCSGRRS